MPGLSAPRVVIAHKIGTVLKDEQGAVLRITPDRLLRRMGNSTLRPNLLNWLKQPAQRGQLETLIDTTPFLASARRDKWVLLTCLAEWNLLWACPLDPSMPIIIHGYEHLSATEERDLIVAGCLREHLLHAQSKLSLVKVGVECGYLGLTKRRFAAVIGLSEPGLYYYLDLLHRTASGQPCVSNNETPGAVLTANEATMPSPTNSGGQHHHDGGDVTTPSAVLPNTAKDVAANPGSAPPRVLGAPKAACSGLGLPIAGPDRVSEAIAVPSGESQVAMTASAEERTQSRKPKASKNPDRPQQLGFWSL